jgi:hypothetical protein
VNKIEFYIGKEYFCISCEDKERAIQEIKRIVEENIGKSLISQGKPLDTLRLIEGNLVEQDSIEQFVEDVFK